ncbi:MAG TPA: CoA-binding protein [Acidimicrobiales bacterium]|nr:CoA-binding protein [Acidimicrobiales bacterium]
MSGLGAPDAVDMVYVFRPPDELPGVVETAQAMGATCIGYQSGRSEDGERDPDGCWLSERDAAWARDVARSSGITFVERPYILNAIRRIT